MDKFKVVLAFLSYLSLVSACRHSFERYHIAVTSFEFVLFVIMIICFAWFSWLVPTVLMTYCEIRDILAERKRRYFEYRKLQKKNLQVHVPLHFLRNYYEQESVSWVESQSIEHSRRRVINVMRE